MKEQDKPERESRQEKFVEGIDYYFENGLMVLTANFLRKRGYCCHNNCRHCPYPKTQSNSLKQKDC